MSGPLGTLHVLLVDDNPNMRSIVSAMLRSAGVGRISEADTGPEALAIMARTPVDIVVADFRMEPMDGVALTRHLRHHTDSPDPYVPVVMMTGHSEPSRVAEARDAGVNAFVTKPITSQLLLKRIETIILKPRPFVRSVDYFGPDRRRRNVLDYPGPFRRATDQPIIPRA